MKKKLLLLFTILAIGLTNVWAYDFSAVAPTGQTLYYTIFNGNVEVDYPNASSGRSMFEPWYGYTTPTGVLEIPSSVEFNGITYPVTGIGSNAFYDCTRLTSVTIPNSVTSIGNYAFYNCNGLTSVTIPNSVTSIGNYAFSYCSLYRVMVPNSVTSIGDYAFYGVRVVRYCGSATGSPWGANNAGCFHVEGDFIYSDAFKTTLYAYIGTGTSANIPYGVIIIAPYAFANCSELTSVTLPPSIGTILSGAFYGCSGLSNLSIPLSTTTIGDYAFYGCSSLTNIIVDNHNMDFDSRNNCNAIINTHTNTLIAGCRNTTIPNTVTAIADYAFAYCNGLTNVNIPNSVTTIGDYAFANCPSLTTARIGTGVTSMGNGVFAYCPNLNTLYYNPTNCTTIGSSASYDNIPMFFAGYQSAGSSNMLDNSVLTHVFIGNNVTNIPSRTFYGCSGINCLSIPNSVTSIGNNAFYHVGVVNYCGSATGRPWGATRVDCFYQEDDFIYENATKETLLAYIGTDTSVTIPNSVITIADKSFYGCNSITSITIPNSVTTIGDRAFEGCNRLTSVTIPNSVATIGLNAFYGCASLTSATIGTGVNSIGGGAFNNCTNLTSLFFNATNCTTMGSTYNPVFTSATYYSYNYIDYIDNTTLTTVVFGDNVTNIPANAFINCAALDNITIPNSVTNIGLGAFNNCTSLTTLYFNATNCTTMGSNNESVFASYTYHDGYYGYRAGDNTTLNTVVFGDNVTNIPAYAFRNCTALNNVTIPSSVTSIGESAFYGCSSLASVNIPNSVTTIGACAFKECGVTSLTIPATVETIGNEAFAYCYNLNTLYFNATNCTYPSYYEFGMFAYDTMLTNVVFGENITNIPAHAFQHCRSITNITIPNSVTTIGEWAFFGCSGLTSVTIPNSVTTIEDDAFSGCSGLTSLTIPNSVTSIGWDAFFGCSGLTSLTIPNSVTSIGARAFYGCSGITEITSEAITAPLLGQYAFEGVNPMIPVNIPCGRMLSYMSRWSYFSNFVEGAGYSFEATSDNPAMGYVTVLTQPTCSAPQAVVNAVAIPGYRFDHWSNGSTANPYSFNLSQNTSLVAYFAVAARDTVFVHDTTFVNVFVPVHDTTFIDNYIHDTTIVNNYIHDTTTVTQWQYDTTYVNVYVPVHDTTFIDNYIHDTTIVNNYIHDTAYVDVYIHDTTFVEVLVHDTLTITEELNWYVLNVVSGDAARGLVAGNGRFPENTEVEIAAIPIIGSRFVQWQDGNTDNPRRVSVENDMSFVATFDVAEVGVTDVETMLYSIYAQDGRIVVENASDAQIRIFDTLGRCISTNKSKEYTRIFNMPASGVYMVQVGNTPAQKVVVVR